MGTNLKYWGNTPNPPRRRMSRPFGMKHHPFDPLTGEHLPLGKKGSADSSGSDESSTGSRVYDMVQMNAGDPAGFLSSKVAGSIMPSDDDVLMLDGETVEPPGASKVYGTDGEGTKGWQDASVGTLEDPGAAVDTIGSAAEGDEAAETSTWTTGSDNGLAIWVQTRAAYYDTGDMKLYGYFRLMTYDKYGRLYSVSAETRVIIDTPVPEN